MTKLIQVYEPENLLDGAKVTYSTPHSRKSFTLARPKEAKSQPPVAVESFALDPDYYASLMKEVESLHRKRKK
jgi:hypothetical protein